jgi:hypothetical protein
VVSLEEVYVGCVEDMDTTIVEEQETKNGFCFWSRNERKKCDKKYFGPEQDENRTGQTQAPGGGEKLRLGGLGDEEHGVLPPSGAHKVTSRGFGLKC